VEAEQAMTDLRVAVSFSEKALERAIRQVSLLAHAADNNATGGLAFKALFPNGLDAELRPIGASQVTASITLRERLDIQPAAAKVKAQAMDDFDKALSVLKTAIDARQAGDSKVSQARASNLARASASSLPTTATSARSGRCSRATAPNKTCTSMKSPPATPRPMHQEATHRPHPHRPPTPRASKLGLQGPKNLETSPLVFPGGGDHSGNGRWVDPGRLSRSGGYAMQRPRSG
jgi:hypothetical protein